MPLAPYRGIESFGYADQPIFFARQREKRELLRLVVIHRGVFLYGESGSGKSSLINAGLIPAAQDEGFRADRIRVQPRPGEELVVERITSSADDGRFLPSNLAGQDDDAQRVVLSTDALRERLRALPADVHPRPLLIFDQFEELITLFEESRNGADARDARAAQQGIVTLLVELLRDRTLPVKLLFGFREDYLAKAKELLARCPELVDQSLRLTAPTTAALDEIVRGPFREHPGRFPSELSEDLAARLSERFAAHSESGVLNLSEVQIVCLRLWQSPDPARLLAEKDVPGLLEDYLQESLGRFSDQDRELAIGLLSHMVTAQGTRNVIATEDLIQRTRAEDDAADDHLRLVLADLEAEAKLVRRELRHDVYLYEVVSEFLLPWVARQREERLQARAARAEALRQEKARNRLVLIAVGVTVLAALLAVAGIFAWRLERDAQGAKELAEAQKNATNALLTLESEPLTSLRLANEAVGLREIPETELALRRALAVPRLRADLPEFAPVLAAALGPDGRQLATVWEDGSVRIWDVANKRPGRPLHPSGESVETAAAAFSPRGDRIVVATGATARIWQLAPAPHAGHPLHAARLAFVTSVAFSEDGNRAVVGTSDGKLRVWDVATGGAMPPVGIQGGEEIEAAALSADGKRVTAVDGAGWVRVWDLETRSLVGKPFQVFVPIGGATFNADGTRLAVVSTRTAQIWDVKSRTLVAQVQGLVESVGPDAFSPGGQLLVTVSPTHTALVSDVSSGVAVEELKGAGDITSAAFSPDGRFLDTVAARGDQVWYAPAESILLDHRGLQKGAASSPRIAFDPQGTRGAFTRADGRIQIFETSTGKEVAVVGKRARQPAVATVFSSDGRRLATVASDGTERVSDLSAGGATSRRLDGVGEVSSAAFSTEATLVVTVSDRVARVSDVATGELIGRPIGSVESVGSAAFSADGKLLVTVGTDGTARISTVSTGQSVRSGFGHSVSSAALSPDGRLVVVASSDGQTMAWHVAPWDTAWRHVLQGAAGNVDVAFGPDSEVLVIGNGDGTVSVVQAEDEELVTSLPGGSVGVGTIVVSPDGTRVVTASEDGTARVRPCEVCAPVAALRGYAEKRLGKDGNSP